MLHVLGLDVAIAVGVFAVVWAICVRVHNYGFLDVTWTLTIGGLALVDGLLGSGDPGRRVALTVLGLAWSLRLGLFIFARVLRHHPVEDKRYKSLRQQWKSPLGFLAFFELQALISVVFSVPFLVAAFANGARLSLVEMVGMTLAGVGIVGEAVADHQSQAFKRRADPGHTILDVGLWRYSRHPNYFFEIVSWVGFAIAASPLPLGWVAIVCPVLISYFLLRVTGVPLTEKHSLESHGDIYRNYQRKTSVLIPWAPKSG